MVIETIVINDYIFIILYLFLGEGVYIFNSGIEIKGHMVDNKLEGIAIVKNSSGKLFKTLW